MIDSKKVVDGYLRQRSWKVNENSNAPYSFGALNKALAASVSKDYWLTQIYPEDIAEAHADGSIHMHDLGGLTLYCCGYSLQNIITKGVRGVANIPVSKPAGHFSSILNQLANLTTIFQNEIMGAVAFSSFDTYLAPFVKKDKLSYEEVRQNMQNYIFSVNSNSRAGAEPAFSNVTFDLTPPDDLLNKPVLIGGKYNYDVTYKDCQAEMDMINRAFCELMLEGDYAGRPFAYPIPTYNMHKRTDWDNPIVDLVCEMAGRHGTPYFGNFINSDMDVSDVRSMCCRLRLDLRELRRKTGGLFGADDNTGSIGVVTLNLPRYAFMAENEQELFLILRHFMDLAKDSLELKRHFLNDEILSRNAVPAFMEYVGTLDNHFSTIGLVGMNEMCLNASWLGKDLTHAESQELCERVLNYMRKILLEYQDETGHLYNLEATPAESTAHRLALKDVARFPTIKTQGEGKRVYYTNSCRLPVDEVKDIEHAASVAGRLQTLFTGGTAEHFYLGQSISSAKAKHIVKTVLTNYPIPYISLSPLIRYCDLHGFQTGKGDECPQCGAPLEKYQRITGYIRNVKYFNNGKAAEFEDRNQL